MDQQQPDVPTYQPPTAQPAPATGAANKKRKTLALWLLIGPTALIVGSIILYAVANFIFAQFSLNTPVSGQMFSTPTLGSRLVNVILFIVGAVSVMAWLPGVIIGIVLLTTQKKA